jgi:hypothetical protein
VTATLIVRIRMITLLYAWTYNFVRTCTITHMQVVRAAIYDETGYWYPSIELVQSLHARLSALALVSMAHCKHALLYCSCQALIGFIFLSGLVPVATLLLFPLQAFVALRFSQVSA